MKGFVKKRIETRQTGSQQNKDGRHCGLDHPHRHCERSEAIQNAVNHMIASGGALTVTLFAGSTLSRFSGLLHCVRNDGQRWFAGCGNHRNDAGANLCVRPNPYRQSCAELGRPQGSPLHWTGCEYDDCVRHCGLDHSHRHCGLDPQSHGRPETSFPPDFNNKTTSVARESHIQLPHYLIYTRILFLHVISGYIMHKTNPASNEVIRLYVFVTVNALLRFFVFGKLGRNEVCLSTNCTKHSGCEYDDCVCHCGLDHPHRHCERSEAIQNAVNHMIASGDVLTVTLFAGSTLSRFSGLLHCVRNDGQRWFAGCGNHCRDAGANLCVRPNPDNTSTADTETAGTATACSPKGFIFITAGRDLRKTVSFRLLPERQDRRVKSCLSGSFIGVQIPQVETCGYENPAFQAVSSAHGIAGLARNDGHPQARNDGHSNEISNENLYSIKELKTLKTLFYEQIC
jgi:hypothetical protein